MEAPLPFRAADWDSVTLDRAGHGPYRLMRGLLDRQVRRFEVATRDPERAQREVLATLLRGAEGTLFALRHRLEGVRDLETFRRRVPVATWSAFAPWVDRIAAGEPRVLTRAPVRQFLETSGTTGARKLIPVTDDWSRRCAEAQQLWVLSLLREHEGLARGAALTMVSPAVHGHTAAGIPYGSNTGRMHLAQPWWVRFRYPVPYEVYGLADPEARLYALLRFALQADIRSISTANPTTILLLCRKLLQHRDPLAEDLAAGTLRAGPAARLEEEVRKRLERRLRRVAPPEDWRPARLWDLQVVNCWKGGSAAWFLPLLPDALGADLPVREVGISASESFVALALSDRWPGAVAWPLGELLEFVEDSGAVRGLWELEAGGEYRLVITGAHGLYRYDLQDRVRVIGSYRRTPVLAFLRREGSVLNATGEKLTEEQVLQAMEETRRRLDLPPMPFTLGLALAAVPTYRLAVEAGAHQPGLALVLDRALSEANVEYAGKRSSGRLGPVEVHVLPPGTFRRLRDAAVAAGTPEGQYKDPILALDEGAWARLVAAGG